MKHAAELDLIAYEDPVFYDRLERARVQATDRLGMIQQIGRLIQLVITTITLVRHNHRLFAVADVVAVAGCFPRFWARVILRSWATPRIFARRRSGASWIICACVGGSKEAAKELKLFGLADFLTARFTRLSDQIYEENVRLSRRKLIAGGFLSIIATAWLLLRLCVS